MTQASPRSHDRYAFKIAVICALPVEAEMIQAVFDESWHDAVYSRAYGDPNSYTLGKIGRHNVVLAHMPNMDSNSAAVVAAGLRTTFHGIEIAFVVGLCGAVPSQTQEIVLGDCMISTHVVQYDFGRQYPHGFIRKDDNLGRAPTHIRSLIAKLATPSNHEWLTGRLVSHLEALEKERTDVRYPGWQRDRLFQPSYVHRHQDGAACDSCLDDTGICSKDCDALACEESKLVQRTRFEAALPDTLHSPQIRFGGFGSANTVMKSGLDRDRIATRDGLIAFEMEGSGVWDVLPTIIVKSACDYADSHKSKEWQLYAAATAAAGLKALLERHEIADDSHRKDRYCIPFSINALPVTRNFIARPAEIQCLEESLLPRPNVDRRRVFVLHGLGGIGKTQLAIEFMRQHRSKFSAMLWLDGSSEDNLKQSLAKYAGKIAPGQMSDASRAFALEGKGDVDAVVREILDWLAAEDNRGWLLVFDNVNQEVGFDQSDLPTYDIEQYLPDADHGSILLTTRLTQIAQLGQSCEVRKAEKPVAQAILASWYPKATNTIHTTHCERLLELLDGLPLAIAQAGAYLQKSSMHIEEYLHKYEQKQNEVNVIIQRPDFKLKDYPNRNVWTTWSISYEAIQKKSEHAANLLLFWSYCNHNDFWFGIFAKVTTWCAAADELRQQLGDIAEQESSFFEAIELLRDYSLIEGAEETEGFTMHTVVHRWVYLSQAQQDKSDLVLLALLAFVTLGAAVPNFDEPDAAQQQQRLLPHAQTCCEQVCNTVQTELETIQDYLTRSSSSAPIRILSILEALNGLGNLYTDQDKLTQAEQMYAMALAGKERALGPEHSSTLETVNNLGLLYEKQGKLAEAEGMYIRSLAGARETFGTTHTNTLSILNNLGIIYARQGKLDKAEEMYLEALIGHGETTGPKGTYTLKTVGNLGLLYAKQGRLLEAKLMYTRALEGKKEVFGHKHRTTLGTVHNLGLLYARQGKLDKAEDMYKTALAGYEEVLGPEHTRTLTTLRNMHTLNKTREAIMKPEELIQHALEDQEEAVGPTHNSALDALGQLYARQGKFDEAEKMYKRALQDKERELGVMHESTLDTVHYLADLYRDRGEMAEAEVMYLRALQGYEAIFGAGRFPIFASADNLARIYHKQGKLQEAESMYLRSLRGYEEASTIEHGSVCLAFAILGSYYYIQDRPVEAEKMYLRALQGYEELFGVELVKVYIPALTTMRALGDLYWETRPAEAQAMYAKALPVFMIAYGPSSEVCIYIKQRLDALNSEQGSTDVGPDVS